MVDMEGGAGPYRAFPLRKASFATPFLHQALLEVSVLGVNDVVRGGRAPYFYARA